MSYNKIFLYVLGVDVIISLISFILFPHGGFRDIMFLFGALVGACATGVLGLLFLLFGEMRQIGKVLIANVIMFPVVMIGLLMLLLG